MPVIAGFLIGGALWGAAARAWMRAVSDDPEFSWSGTLFIVGLFTVAGTAQGIALAVRSRGWPRWAQTPVRVVAGCAALLLGAGAGTVMLPALVAGSLALARRDWPRSVRNVLAAVATLDVVAMIPLLHAELPWFRTIVGWILMVPLYAVIIWAIALNLRPLDDGWRLGRRARVVAVVAIGALPATFLALSVLGV